MKLGTMQVVLKSADDAANFERAKRLGLAGIEPDLSLEELSDPNHPRVNRLRKLIEHTGVVVPSVCLGVYNEDGLIAKPDRQPIIIREIGVAIQWAAALGSKVILLPFFFANDPRDDSAQLKRTAELLAPLCAQAAARGIVLCYEGTLAAEQLHEMADRIKVPAGFGVYFDLANVVWVGMDGPQQIRLQGDLIRQVHMKETKIGPGDVRPGQGRVDYKASAQALAEIGFDQWLILETPATARDEELVRDIALTRNYFPID